MSRLILLLGIVEAGCLPSVAQGYEQRIPAQFSEDGRLFMAQMASDLVVWNLEAKKLEAKIPRAQCRQVEFAKQDGWVLCVGDGVSILDWKRQAIVASIPKEPQTFFKLLAYSRDDNRIVLQQGNDAVSVWQLDKTLVPIKDIRVNAGKEVPFIAASPDTKTLAIVLGQTIRLHDLRSTAVREIAITEGKPLDLLFAPNGGILAASIGNTILLIEANGGSVYARATLSTAEGARGHITPLVFSRDSRRLVANNFDWSFPLFDTDSGKMVSLTEFTYEDKERAVRSKTHLYAADISADAEYLVAQPEHPYTLQIWDVRTGSILPDLCGDDCRNMGPQVSLLKWSPTGSKIVVAMSGMRDPEVNGKLSVWDVQSRAPELVLDAGQSQVKVLAKRAGQPIAAVTAKTPTTSNAGTGPASVHELAIRAMATSPSATVLVTSADDGILKVWDPGKGVLLRQMKLVTPASAVAFSANGNILAAGTTQGEIRLWDTQTWREYPPYSSRQGNISALQFLPGERFLVIAGGQPKVLVVDLVSREVVKELIHTSYYEQCDVQRCETKRATQGDVVDTVALLDGSSFLLTASRTGRVVWDIVTWKEIEKPAGFPKSWSGLGWKRPFLSTTTPTSNPNAFTFAVWDIVKNAPIASFDTFTNGDTEVLDRGTPMYLGASLAVDLQQKWVATRIGEKISLWDMQTQAKKKTFIAKAPYHLHWTSDGKHLIVGTLDRKVLVVSADTLEPLHYLRDPSVVR